ncbi:hypothetical protein ILYODFUR_009474 [Ilyodon furcidens]|uniref:Secreted protein n=1 Tax=Ilyodon furcidens TaxID=33524 RepID=A0ABV0SJU3_9TELE
MPQRLLYLSSLQSGRSAQCAAAEWTRQHRNKRYRAGQLIVSSGNQEDLPHENKEMRSAVALAPHGIPLRNVTCL